MKWLIYKHTNKINGKCYIGQTKQTASIRWANGLGYKSRSCIFWNAIKKYGWNNFEHQILEDNINTQEDANDREIFWIKHFNSYVNFENSNGYNMTLGGNNGEHLGYSVYQIDKKTLKIIKEFPSTAEASRQFGSENNSSQIRNCCDGIKRSAKGYFWCYKKNYSKIWEPKANKLVTPVYQINDKLEVIQKYDSITDYVKKTGFSGGSIVSCCLRKQRKANNYYWCYLSDYNENWKPPQMTFNRNEKIYCFETNKIYMSALIASQQTGANRSHILRCCKQKENGTNGLHFCYAKDVSNYEIKSTHKHGKIFTEEENEILRKNYPVMGTSKELRKLLPNRTQTSIHQQAHKLNLQVLYPNQNKFKQVLCIELNKTFNSIEDAYKFIGLRDGSSITRCCRKQRQTAGGYHWKYID